MSLHWGPIVSPLDPPLPAALPTESGLRTRDASELRAFLKPYLKDYGITRVAHLTGFDNVGLPVHMACKPQGRTLASGSGKGVTTDGSWVSAVMECGEQAVWERLDLETIHATEAALRRLGVNVARGADLPLLKGHMWSDDLAINWVAGWDIVSGQETWVPAALVDVSVQGGSAHRTFAAGSNGLASGAHILEAVLSGLQEAIERDGMALHITAVPRAAMDADRLIEHVAPDIAEKVYRANLRIEIVDCTTDIGVPTIAAFLMENEFRAGSFKGGGAGTSVRTALIRAVTEAAQARCLITAGARDDIFELARSSSRRFARQFQPQQLEEYFDTFDASTGTVVGDIEWYVQRLRDRGFDQVIVLRHSSPGDPIQVARVIVPGIEGYYFSTSQPGQRHDDWRKANAVHSGAAS